MASVLELCLHPISVKAKMGFMGRKVGSTGVGPTKADSRRNPSASTLGISRPSRDSLTLGRGGSAFSPSSRKTWRTGRETSRLSYSSASAIANAKDAFAASLRFNAKCVAALKRAYVERLNKREIPPDTTFKKHFVTL